MATKKIIPGKVKSNGIIDIGVKDILSKKIRNNYALFGDRAKEIKAYCINIKNLDKKNDQFYDLHNNMGFKVYTLTESKDGNICVKLGTPEAYYPITLLGKRLVLRKAVEMYSSEFHKVKCDDPDFYIDSILNEYNNGNKGLESFISADISEKENTIIISGETKYIENSNEVTNTQNITYCKMNNITVDLKDNKDIWLIVIFTGVKSAPLVRIYPGDIKRVTGYTDLFIDLVGDFEDKHAIFNSYYEKFDYYTETRSITTRNIGIESMKYENKIEDIFNYLKGETYIEDPEVYDVKYINENGIVAEYFERFNSDTKGCYDIVKKILYKRDVALFHSIITKDLKTGEIINTRDDLFEMAIAIDSKPYIEKFNTYATKLSYTIGTTFNTDTSLEAYDMDTFKVMSAHDRVRMLAYAKEKDMSLSIDLLNNETYALLIFNYKAPNGIENTVTMFIDNDITIFFNNKTVYSNSYSLTHLGKNKYVKNGKDMFIRGESYIEGTDYKTIAYEGIEGKFSIIVDKNKKAINICHFESPIYSINDDFIYVRDEFGVPEKINLR